jgi:CubicO group peptidase (beta-lactamase class C family)
VLRPVFSFVFAVSMISCSAQTPAGVDKRISRLESSIPRLMEKARVPGLQIALIDDGAVAWEQGFGTTNTSGGDPVTTDTIFEAASLTKPLFAYAVMMLVEEGVVDLDRPVVDVASEERIEEFLGHPVDADGFRADWFRAITPRHILSHSAGMAHGERGNPYPLFFEPGTDWKYSADGYVLLQWTIEEITGLGLDEIIAAKVLGPLGMERSSMVWRDAYETTMANGHELYGSPVPFRKRTEPNAAASLYTTAGDYARFAAAVIKGEGLEPTTADEMLRWVVDMADDSRVGWSLGFGLQRDDRGAAFWQWGDYGVFRNYVIADREQRSGVVYLTNSFNGLAVCGEVVAASLGREALGNAELEYQPADGPFYELLWAAKDGGAEAVAGRLPAAVADHPEIFTPERISGMGSILLDEGMTDEALVFHRFNLEQHPESGERMADLANSEMLAGNFAHARELFAVSGTAPEDALDPARIGWIMGYLQAMERPAPLDEAALQAIAGDYGPRHLRVRDKRLYYSRDTTDPAAQRPLAAISDDTFVLENVTYFRLQVVFGEDGRPVKLVGLYEDGGSDESPRD